MALEERVQMFKISLVGTVSDSSSGLFALKFQLLDLAVEYLCAFGILSVLDLLPCEHYNVDIKQAYR